MNEMLQAFKNHIKGKKIALVGMGISNKAAVPFLSEAGAILTARDKSEKPDDKTAELLEKYGVTPIYGSHYLENFTEDYILKSPGIRYDIPELQKAAANGCIVTSEMEIFCKLCPCKIFAVTGSDGKTTTTTVISEILKRASDRNGTKTYVGGNIGTPLLPYLDGIREDDFAVLELSSFQLHTMQFSPTVAVVTNVTPNHLNWHTDMAEYIEAKKHVYQGQTADARLVLNFENEITRAMAKEAKGRFAFFSSKEKPPCDVSCYLENGNIYYNDGRKVLVMTRADIKIPGLHNVENYMAAILATRDYATFADVREVAKTFAGVRHRIEFVRKVNGVSYYNSSIDSSPTRTMAALSAFNTKLIVIIGGYDKKIPIEPMLQPLMEKAKYIVATGDTGEAVRNAVLEKGYPENKTVYIKDFHEAVSHAVKVGKEGDTVLLSPAAASFDAFPNFEVRGDCFCDIINKI